VPDGQPAPSLTGVFAGAAWYERETFEMFGIDFAGYHDRVGAPIRPLLLPEGFEGNPLKKSFMLAARASKAWPGAKEPGEGHAAPGAGTGRRRVQAPGVPDLLAIRAANQRGHAAHAELLGQRPEVLGRTLAVNDLDLRVEISLERPGQHLF
jgi:hypothetical protein